MNKPLKPTDFPMHQVTFGASDICWIFTGKWRLLDNFAAIPTLYNGITYKTSEHAFAAAKAATKQWHDRIANAPDPNVAKMLGRRCKIRDDWDEIKFQVMYEIVRSKMRHSAPARALLRHTGVRRIYEGNSWHDQVWGVTNHQNLYQPGFTATGQNGLGEILMMVRREIA